jgi:hypothetical protein
MSSKNINQNAALFTCGIFVGTQMTLIKKIYADLSLNGRRAIHLIMDSNLQPFSYSVIQKISADQLNQRHLRAHFHPSMTPISFLKIIYHKFC